MLSPAPQMAARNIICNMSILRNGCTKLEGTIFIIISPKETASAGATDTLATEDITILLPGFSSNDIPVPVNAAIVVMTINEVISLPPMRPSSEKLPDWAIQLNIEKNTTGQGVQVHIFHPDQQGVIECCAE